MTDQLATAMVPASDTIIISPEHIRAVELHRRIMADAEVAGSAIISMAKALKEMRDTRLYTELGHADFESYVEDAVGLKQRQAYNYISVLEKLPAHILQSTAHLGITKLELLTRVPELDKADFIEEHDLDGMSVRKMAETIKQLRGDNEQLAFDLAEAREDTAQDSASAADMAELEAKLRAEIARLSAQHPDTEAIEAARIKAEADAAQKIKQAQHDAQAEIESVKAEAQKEREAAQRVIKDARSAQAEASAKADARAAKTQAAAVEAARTAALEEAAARNALAIAALDEERQQALRRARELESQLKVAGDSDTLRFSFAFEEFQGAFNRLHGIVLKIRAGGREEDAAKMSSALYKALGMLRDKLKGEDHNFEEA